jgi:hypothetical protein
MSVRVWICLVVLWACSLFGAGAWASAQGRQWTPLAPSVLAGDDVGFRVEWMNGRTPTGTLVVRVNGEWVEARIGKGPGEQVVPRPPLPPPAPR